MMLPYQYIKRISLQRLLQSIGVRIPMQMVIGLILLSLCVLLIAQELRLMPDPDADLMRGRVILAEQLARRVAEFESHQNQSGVKQLLQSKVGRDDVLSACLRKNDGTVIAQTAGHDQYWADAPRAGSTITHMQLALMQANKQFGQVEITFSAPRHYVDWKAWWSMPVVQLMAFILCGQLLLFWLYISRMLTVLDPSSAVPSRMQLLMDTLVEGMVVLDHRGHMVMVNQSFARTTFASPEQLIGRKLSSLAWLNDAEVAPANCPWDDESLGDLQQRGLLMHLRIGIRHSRRLKINVSPILGGDGKRRGVLVTFDDQTAIEQDNLQLSRILEKLTAISQHVLVDRKLSNAIARPEQDSELTELMDLATEMSRLCTSAGHNLNSARKLTETEIKCQTCEVVASITSQDN